ncbi:MAG TPA: DUF1554 domain-containing protein, partial [Leptospiraceae bacterium]|nr:DUF1554 domain-containing protein [Leptospiraceae bacterium]
DRSPGPTSHAMGMRRKARATLCIAFVLASACSRYPAPTYMAMALLAPPAASKRLFTTTTVTLGSIAGVAGADSICASDTARPTAAVYKALIVDSVGNRRACATSNCSGGISENISWVLRPNQAYVRADGSTPVMQTNSAGIFDFNLGNLTNSIDGTTNRFWTGLATDWTVAAATHCSDWTSSSGVVNGERGFPNNVTAAAISSGAVACNAARAILCVEQ